MRCSSCQLLVHACPRAAGGPGQNDGTWCPADVGGPCRGADDGSWCSDPDRTSRAATPRPQVCFHSRATGSSARSGRMWALTTTAAPRRFAALRDRHSRPYLFTAGLSMMGDNIEHVITYWVLWQTFHSPALVGFQVVSHWLPFLLLSVWFGGLAERVRLPSAHPGRPGPVHARLGVLGPAVPHRHARRVGGVRAAGAARLRRRALGPGRAAAAARLRGARGPAGRGPAERDVPQPRDPRRPGRRVGAAARPRRGAGDLRERAVLPADDAADAAHPVHRATPAAGTCTASG